MDKDCLILSRVGSTDLWIRLEHQDEIDKTQSDETSG